MKTNQIMTRHMGDFHVYQRTKDSYFNATELLKQWNGSTGEGKRIESYLSNVTTQEFLKALETEENLNSKNPCYLTARGKNGGTWMHPLMFLDFAMWLNPTFKVKVLKFVQDEMIKFRNLAGDAYPRMCKAVGAIIPKEQYKVKLPALAKTLNMIVYGKHEHEQRNKIGNEAKIRELYELEAQVAQWIELGLVSNKEQLSNALNKLYYQKHPAIIQL